MISQRNKQGWRNPWVLGLLAIVLSGVLINGRMLWNMLHHPMRLLDDHYTVKDHNRYDAKWLQQQAERSTLGWKVKLNSPQQLLNDSLATAESARFFVYGSPADFDLELNDKDGKAIANAKIQVEAQSPGDPTYDFKGEFNSTAVGKYQSRLSFPRAGNWDLLIHADVEGRQFDMEQRVFVVISKQP